MYKMDKPGVEALLATIIAEASNGPIHGDHAKLKKNPNRYAFR